jgi:hypothetical protein
MRRYYSKKSCTCGAKCRIRRIEQKGFADLVFIEVYFNTEHGTINFLVVVFITIK